MIATCEGCLRPIEGLNDPDYGVAWWCPNCGMLLCACGSSKFRLRLTFCLIRPAKAAFKASAR
jgi:hypothetical protein